MDKARKNTWEKIYNTNIGFDFGLLNNRLTGSFEYFIRRIELWGEGVIWFDVMRLNKGVDRRGCGFPNVEFIFYIVIYQIKNQFFGSKVYIYHFIRILQHLVRNPFLNLYTCYAFYVFIQTFYMLDINCRNYVYTGIQQFHYILPTFLIPAALDIGKYRPYRRRTDKPVESRENLSS